MIGAIVIIFIISTEFSEKDLKMIAEVWQGKWMAKVGGDKGSLKGKILRTRKIKYMLIDWDKFYEEINMMMW